MIPIFPVPRAALLTALLFAASFGALAEGSARGADALTLDQAVREGLKSSPQIQRAEAAVEESRWKKNEALGAGFLPKVSASANHYFDVTKYQLNNISFGGAPVLIPAVFPNNLLGLSASIPVFDGLANVRRLQAASLSQDASEEELARAQFELEQQIRLAFYQALAAQKLEEVAHQNVKTLEDHLRQVDIKLKGGAATNYDSLRVQVQLTEGRSDVIDAEDNVVVTRKRLTQLIGLEDDARPLEGTLPTPEAARAQNLELKTISPPERTDLRALELRAQAADKTDSADSAWFIPSVSVAGQYLYYDLQFYDGKVIDNHDYRSAYNLGIFVTWNLFDGGVSYSRAREAAARKTQQEKASEAARLQVPYDFAYWKRRYLSNAERFRAKQLDVERSEESVRLAKEEERAGTRTSTETLDAELDLFRSQAGVVSSQLNAAEALIRLELALGRRI